MPNQLYLNLSIPQWIFFIIFWILLILSLFYYRRTIPPLSAWRRTTLMILRSIALVSLFFLIFQPVLQWSRQHREKPTVAVLFDNSRSMKITDTYRPRGDSLQYAWQQLQKTWNSDSLRLRPYIFSENLEILSADTLDFSGTQTNISRALEQLLDSLTQYNIQSIYLLSDGQFNQGYNPAYVARNSPVPLHTIRVGDSTAKTDIEIAGLRYNPVAYAGDSVMIQLSILQTGLPAGERVVRLREGSRQLAAARLSLPPSGFQREVELTLQAGTPGEFRYVAEIEAHPLEITPQNNQRQFILKVLKRKMNVLLLAGQPTIDQKALVYVLKQIPDIQLTVRTENRLGEFYEGDIQGLAVDSQDVFIFLGYPTSRTPALPLTSIYSALLRGKIPLFLFLTEKTNLAGLDPVLDVLALGKKSRLMAVPATSVRISAAGLRHPATRVEEDTQFLSRIWQDLPPVISLGKGLERKAGSNILVMDQSEEDPNRNPVVLVSRQNEIKAMIFAACNMAGWHFQLQDDPLRDYFFQRFVQNSVRWLVSREDIGKIHIFPNQKVYRMGEPVEFSGQVFDDFYSPINDARVTVEISGENFQLEDVIPSQGMYYFFRTTGIPAGEYSYRISGRQGERDLGVLSGKMVVEVLELEMQESESNPSLLRHIAAAGGGGSWRVTEFLEQVNHVRYQEQVHLQLKEIVLWNKVIWLLMVVMVLAVEWFLRKRWGLL